MFDCFVMPPGVCASGGISAYFTPSSGRTMIPDLTPVFSRYERLRTDADALFTAIRNTHADRVRCAEGCSDCCHALFDLSLVEALYVNRAFMAAFTHGPERSAILSRAADTDRKLTRIKREMFRAEKDGKSPETIMAEVAGIKLACPLLDADQRCVLYEARPITCRIYGVPTAIAGEGHVCGFSAFEKGQPYPTVQLDKIQAQLDELSRDLAETVGSRFKELHEIYVPLSMALITSYDETYLGIGPAKPDA